MKNDTEKGGYWYYHFTLLLAGLILTYTIDTAKHVATVKLSVAEARDEIEKEEQPPKIVAVKEREPVQPGEVVLRLHAGEHGGKSLKCRKNEQKKSCQPIVTGETGDRRRQSCIISREMYEALPETWFVIVVKASQCFDSP